MVLEYSVDTGLVSASEILTPHSNPETINPGLKSTTCDPAQREEEETEGRGWEEEAGQWERRANMAERKPCTISPKHPPS